MSQSRVLIVGAVLRFFCVGSDMQNKLLVTIAMPILRRVLVVGGSFAVYYLACRTSSLATIVQARSISSFRQVFYGHAVLGQGCCCARRGSTAGALVLTAEPQLQFIVGRRLPRHGDEANPHGPFLWMTYEIPQLPYIRWSMSLLCSCSGFHTRWSGQR